MGFDSIDVSDSTQPWIYARILIATFRRYRENVWYRRCRHPCITLSMARQCIS